MTSVFVFLCAHCCFFIVLKVTLYEIYCAVCLVSQLCLTLCDSRDCNPPGSSVHGDSPGKSTRVGCHALLQEVFPTLGLNPDLPHCRWILYCLSHQGSPRILGCHALLQGIFPTQHLHPDIPHCRWILYCLSHQGSLKILEWVAYPFFRGSSLPRNWTGVSCIAHGFFTSWATREAQRTLSLNQNNKYNRYSWIRICDEALLLEEKRQFLKCVNYVLKILSKDYRNLSSKQNPLIIFFQRYFCLLCIPLLSSLWIFHAPWHA